MKFLVVDDHALIRDALQGVLKELRKDAEILEASDCDQAMRHLESGADIGLILLDLSLPDRDGFAMLAEIRERYATVPVVVLSAQQERDAILKALELGALGFIPKSAKRGVMLSALQLVFSGGIYLPPEILGGADSMTAAEAKRSAPDPGPPSPTDLGLTERQIQVLGLMMQGKSNKAICRTLNLAENTVKNHVTALLKALKASNRTEAVVTARNFGWQLPRTPKL